MKIVLYGATGNSGQRILQELTNRGHEVTAVARNTSKVPSAVKAVKDDLGNVDSIASVIANQFTEATGDLYLQALVELGLVLFLLTFLLNGLARLLIVITAQRGGGTAHA